MSIYEPKLHSYELNKEMMAELAEEFDVEALATDFAKAVDGKSGDEAAAEAEKFFTDYGTRWIRKSHKLGEEYPDRTYEVLLEAIDSTDGYLRFALVPQRFLEIAYLATQDFPHLTVIENNQKRLIYRLKQCKTYEKLKETCGDELASQRAVDAMIVEWREIDGDEITIEKPVCVIEVGSQQVLQTVVAAFRLQDLMFVDRADCADSTVGG